MSDEWFSKVKTKNLTKKKKRITNLGLRLDHIKIDSEVGAKGSTIVKDKPGSGSRIALEDMFGQSFPQAGDLSSALRISGHTIKITLLAKASCR